MLIYIVNILVICVIIVLAFIIVIAITIIIAIAIIIMVIIIVIIVRRSALPDIVQTYGHYALSPVSNGFTETVDSSFRLFNKKALIDLLVLDCG